MAKRILLVDDDQYIRELYEEVLREEGYQVMSAVDGEDGLAKINASQYDLILLDVMMPKLDGIGLLKKLKEHPSSYPPKAIVLLTNLGNEQVIKEAMSLGANAYLIKADITPDILLEKIKTYFPAGAPNQNPVTS